MEPDILSLFVPSVKNARVSELMCPSLNRQKHLEISKTKINKENFDKLVKHSEQRGIDSSGLVYLEDDRYKISRTDYNIEKLLKLDDKIIASFARNIPYTKKPSKIRLVIG